MIELSGMAMKIRLKFYGAFRTAAKTSELLFEVREAPTVRSLLMQLVSRKEFESLKQLLLQSGTSDPRANALIMISGREINTLSGLETVVTENDEVAILPIAHGG